MDRKVAIEVYALFRPFQNSKGGGRGGWCGGSWLWYVVEDVTRTLTTGELEKIVLGHEVGVVGSTESSDLRSAVCDETREAAMSAT